MSNSFRSRTGRALSAALLAGTLGGCEFIEPTTLDPNNVSAASADQLLTGVQVNTFYLTESIYARLASMWTQQTAGVNAQFTALDQYKLGEDDFDDEMASHYAGGGLVDIRQAIEITEEAGRRPYAGVLKVYEALLIGMAASLYGDIPYSQAVDAEIGSPELDPQLEVYAAVQARLDEAIADLQATGTGPGSVDLNFGGNKACWTAVAYSLKARYHLHTAEVRGDAAYQDALAAAQKGISSVACNLRAIHSTAATETNIWHQFNRDRPEHIVAGGHLVDILNGGTRAVTSTADDDPRLRVFFKPATGDFAGLFIGSPIGSPANDPNVSASPLNTDVGGVIAAGFDQRIVSCAETQLIIAEAQYRLGRPAEARQALNAALNCEEAFYATQGATISLPAVPATLSGPALLEEILEQKYVALFLNIEAYNDYKRTCFPRIETFEGKEVPGRFLYGTTERQTNPNIPDVQKQRQTPRNANDPNPCPSA